MTMSATSTDLFDVSVENEKIDNYNCHKMRFKFLS